MQRPYQPATAIFWRFEPCKGPGPGHGAQQWLMRAGGAPIRSHPGTWHGNTWLWPNRGSLVVR